MLNQLEVRRLSHLRQQVVPQTTTSPVLTALTPRQVDNVAALGQVWGFLKYFHPVVAAGQRDWDADLLRQLPTVLACRSVAERSRVLSAWLTSLGAVPACQSCVTLPAQPVRLAADLAWAQDAKRFDAPLRQQLAFIAANRYQGIPYYVSTAPAGNPVFAHEEPYADQACPPQNLRYWQSAATGAWCSTSIPIRKPIGQLYCPTCCTLRRGRYAAALPSRGASVVYPSTRWARDVAGPLTGG